MHPFIAPTIFVLLWLGHSWLVERSKWSKHTLTTRMDKQREQWMQVMSKRDMRMIDTNIIGGLQSGTAFFASTSLLAIGAAFTLLNFTDQFIAISTSLPLMADTAADHFQIKAIGLMMLYAYAFLKFSWSYRLFNYASILMGAVPMPKDDASDDELAQAVKKPSQMSVAAGKEFNRGQRAFFIAIGYLGWFLGDIIFLIATLAVYVMLVRRQFFSLARQAVQ